MLISFSICLALFLLVGLASALLNRQSVFALVVLSWAMLAAVFVPLILVLLLGYRPRAGLVLAVMALACGCVLAAHHYGLDGNLFVGLPAVLAALLAYALARFWLPAWWQKNH